MPSFFPRQTIEWRVEEPAALRRLSLSLVETAVLTGVALRLYRVIALSLAGDASGWLFFTGTLALGAAILLGAAAMHLGNFPLHRWIWRAPAFGAVAAGAELVTSLLLIAVGREAIGTGRATFADWPGIAATVLVTRVVAVSLFAIVLAGVVQGVRVLLLRHEHRDHTVRAVHEEQLRHHDAST
ncbi:MAG TPA: hypothetical protein VGE02_16045 [Gemmatimonadales bacterium]